MIDIVSGDIRSKMMAGIKGKNTKGEVLIRKGLHNLGFRYQLHRKDLPGNPDLVFPKYKSIIFVNGCFWHAHDCHLFKWPSTRPEFWEKKISENKIRDCKNIVACTEMGWKVLIIWECSYKGKTKRKLEEVLQTAAKWILYDTSNAEIEGYKT